MSDELSPGEIGRSLQRLEVALAGIGERLDRLGESYVRREVYEVGYRALSGEVMRAHERVTDAEETCARRFGDIDKRARDNFRLALTGLALPVVVAVLAAIIVSAVGT